MRRSSKRRRLRHAHGFIKRLPDGYDTVLGEDGGSLSQGQKQLLCIARVMLCLPPMLISGRSNFFDRYQNGIEDPECICKNDGGTGRALSSHTVCLQFRRLM